MDVETVLEHFGIKGQKWGVRRKNPSGSRVKSLSDEELRARVDRLNLEQRYSQLSKGSPSALSRGGKIAAGIIGPAVSKAVRNVARKRIEAYLEKIVPDL